MESNHPSGGLLRPAGFEDTWLARGLPRTYGKIGGLTAGARQLARQTRHRLESRGQLERDHGLKSRQGPIELRLARAHDRRLRQGLCPGGGLSAP